MRNGEAVFGTSDTHFRTVPYHYSRSVRKQTSRQRTRDLSPHSTASEHDPLGLLKRRNKYLYKTRKTPHPVKTVDRHSTRSPKSTRKSVTNATDKHTRKAVRGQSRFANADLALRQALERESEMSKKLISKLESENSRLKKSNHALASENRQLTRRLKRLQVRVKLLDRASQQYHAQETNRSRSLSCIDPSNTRNASAKLNQKRFAKFGPETKVCLYKNNPKLVDKKRPSYRLARKVTTLIRRKPKVKAQGLAYDKYSKSRPRGHSARRGQMGITNPGHRTKFKKQRTKKRLHTGETNSPTVTSQSGSRAVRTVDPVKFVLDSSRHGEYNSVINQGRELRETGNNCTHLDSSRNIDIPEYQQLSRQSSEVEHCQERRENLMLSSGDRLKEDRISRRAQFSHVQSNFGHDDSSDIANEKTSGKSRIYYTGK